MRVLGVLNGNDTPLEMLQVWCASADIIVAADGGADRILVAGFTPHAVVGDMDSTTNSEYRGGAEDDQETTDCDKLLAHCERANFTSVTLIGYEGDRVDHMLATLSSCASSNLDLRLVGRVQIGVLVSQKATIVLTGPRKKVSVIPLTPCYGVDLEGVAWPLKQADLALGERISISNESLDRNVYVRIGEGTAVLFVEADTREPSW